jgi:hypothetical protein
MPVAVSEVAGFHCITCALTSCGFNGKVGKVANLRHTINRLLVFVEFYAYAV